MKKLLCLLAAAALTLSLCSCGQTATVNAPAAAPAADQTAPAAPAADAPADAENAAGTVKPGTYTYEEHLDLGGQKIDSTWTLALADDGTYQLDTQIMGKPTTLTGTYTPGKAEGEVVTGTPTEGAPSMVVFFEKDGSCTWQLNADGSCAPASAGGAAGMPGAPGGAMPAGGSAGAADANFAAVAYADNAPDQVMDVFLPEKATGKDAVIVLVHGGGFKFGDQTMDIIRPVIDAARANGYVVASVDYRKSGEATFPAAVADVKAAVRYLKANAATYGIDPEKVVVWGESAGAYLSLMTALTPEVKELNGDVTANLDQNTEVAALVDFYGPVEFYTMDEEYAALGVANAGHSAAESFESAFLGQALDADKAATDKTWWSSYTSQLPADYSLYAWVQAGDADENVPYTQSKNFADQLTGLVGEDHVKFTLTPGAAHEDAAFYAEDNLADVFAFLAGALNG